MVKFSMLDRAREHYGATYIATGHYARVHRDDTQHRLARAYDASKDQSYFLSSLHRDMLPRILFPLGTYTKANVRNVAKSARLPNADRKDSQGICFLGTIDMRTFLSKYIDVAPGTVLDEAGKSIGTHEGAALYTIGERHGFHITQHSMNEVPRYIIDKDIAANTLTVSVHPPQYRAGDRFALSSWNELVSSVADGTYDAVLRYHARAVAVTLETVHGTHRIIMQSASEKPSVGQTCVLYRGDDVVASGIIEPQEMPGRI
jgi:tRNA-specific 2-thiouridylase